MKVRWTKDSLRLRITPRELSDLMQGEVVTAVLCLPGGGGTEKSLWTATLQGDMPFTTLSGDGHTVQMTLSQADTACLALPETEGVYFHIDDVFSYYVEKDFPCVHPRPSEAREATTETFAPPPDFEARKA